MKRNINNQINHMTPWLREQTSKCKIYGPFSFKLIWWVRARIDKEENNTFADSKNYDRKLNYFCFVGYYRRHIIHHSDSAWQYHKWMKVETREFVCGFQIRICIIRYGWRKGKFIYQQMNSYDHIRIRRKYLSLSVRNFLGLLL